MANMLDLVNVSSKEKERDAYLEYLYILYSLEIIKKADLSYIDKYIAKQYLMYSQTIPKVEDDVAELFCKNHKSVLIRYVIGNYYELLQNVVSYISLNFPTSNKNNIFQLVPLTPDMHKALTDFFNNKTMLLSIMSVYSKHISKQNDVDKIINDTDILSNLMEEHFRVRDVIKNINTGDNWRRTDKYEKNTNENTLNPELIYPYIQYIISEFNRTTTYYPSADVVDGKDLTEIKSKLNLLCNFLKIVIRTFAPYGRVISTLDEEYDNHVQYCSKARELARRYRYLTSLNQNNVICTHGDVFYDNANTEHTGSYQLDSLVEKYLVLSTYLNGKILYTLW